jgi:cytochrome c
MRLNQSLAISALVVAATAMITPAPGAAAGDPKAGEKVFRKCATCHEVKAPKNKVGPHLVGIFGRPAGTVEGFKYSDAMKNSNVVWDEETISAYVREPKAYIPDNRMIFPGLKKDEDVANLIAYLKEATAQ